MCAPLVTSGSRGEHRRPDWGGGIAVLRVFPARFCHARGIKPRQAGHAPLITEREGACTGAACKLPWRPGGSLWGTVTVPQTQGLEVGLLQASAASACWAGDLEPTQLHNCFPSSDPSTILQTHHTFPPC